MSEGTGNHDQYRSSCQIDIIAAASPIFREWRPDMLPVIEIRGMIPIFSIKPEFKTKTGEFSRKDPGKIS
ncbi:MAG: hypothetical protein JW705_10315 [Methanosarcinaceae archaeon]|nr:hypothetical protein [Methanosarcinaceae archaeon]